MLADEEVAVVERGAEEFHDELAGAAEGWGGHRGEAQRVVHRPRLAWRAGDGEGLRHAGVFQKVCAGYCCPFGGVVGGIPLLSLLEALVYVLNNSTK